MTISNMVGASVVSLLSPSPVPWPRFDRATYAPSPPTASLNLIRLDLSPEKIQNRA